MSQRTEIQILSKILAAFKGRHLEDEDEYAISLARAYLDDPDNFIKEAEGISTCFYRFNRLKKIEFLKDLSNHLNKIKINRTKTLYPCQVFVDDIDSFRGIKKIKPPKTNFIDASEDLVEKAIKLIINEPDKHKHWGGEFSDCFSTQVILNGKRIPTAIVLNGRGKVKDFKKGLALSGCGKNSDQIQRMFEEPAKLFIFQSVSKLHRSIYVEMKTYAIKKSEGGKEEVYYCIIDGRDTERIIKLSKVKTC